MDSSVYVLIPVCALFVICAGWCLLEISRNRRMLKGDPEISSSSAGWEMRKKFHVCLFLALGLRAISIVLEMFYGKVPTSPGHSSYSHSGSDDDWVLSILHVIPSLLFLSTYSLLILFWAQLYYAAWGGSYTSLKPLFFISNSVIYIAFVAVAGYTAASNKRSDFRKYSLYILGVTYFICAVFMIYYGSRVAAQLRPRSTVGSYPARRMVLRRVVMLCTICSGVFLLRSTYCFVADTVWASSGGYPPSWSNPLDFDALFYVIMELIPGVCILLLTRKNAADGGDDANGGDDGDGIGGYSTDGTMNSFDDDGPSLQPFQRYDPPSYRQTAYGN